MFQEQLRYSIAESRSYRELIVITETISSLSINGTSTTTGHRWICQKTYRMTCSQLVRLISPTFSRKSVFRRVWI